ncbi:hypothetical protein N9164_03575 [Draconibacterium sp.]|nr:hypothetical protein [Draconibacterium sp.]
MIQELRRRRLIAAIKNNDLAKVQKLINTIDDINQKDKKGRSLLALAYHYNSTEVIDFLRSKGIREEINRLYSYAKRCLGNNNLLEAKKRFEELKEYFPNDSSVFYHLGNINFKLGKEAYDKTRNIENLNPGLIASKKNISTAIRLSKEDYRLDELKLANANYILSVFYYYRHKYKEAARFSKIALENAHDHYGAKEIFNKASLL